MFLLSFSLSSTSLMFIKTRRVSTGSQLFRLWTVELPAFNLSLASSPFSPAGGATDALRVVVQLFCFFTQIYFCLWTNVFSISINNWISGKIQCPRGWTDLSQLSITVVYVDDTVILHPNAARTQWFCGAVQRKQRLNLLYVEILNY